MRSRRWSFALGALAGAASIAVTCAGCGDWPSYACPDPSRSCEVPDAAPGPSPCAGPCVAPSPADWSNPLLLWIGAPGAAPDCPPEAPHVDYDGYADLGGGDAAACAACACSAPAGTCGPPAVIEASSAACSGIGPGVASIPLATPAEGVCLATATLPSWCGGGVCTRSVTLGALSAVESGCSPVTMGDPRRVPQTPPVSPADMVRLPSHNHGPEPLPWQSAARACTLEAPGACSGDGVCAPASVAGFARCIRTSGDVPCPEGAASFSIRRTFYDGATDTRGCSPCGCAPPQGGICSGSVWLYEDGACASAIDEVAVASTGPVCLDVQPPGTPLGSVRVSALAYQPGTCAPTGGEPTGSLVVEGPTTFCCQPGGEP